MRPRTVFRHLSLGVPSLALLLSLAACGQRADKAEPAASSAESPDQTPQQGQGRRHEATAHLTLAGALTLDADVPVGCAVLPGTGADQGLEFTLGQTGAGPQVQLRISSFGANGETPAGVAIHDQAGSGPAHDWNGTAKVQLHSRAAPGGARKRTVFNGTFDGTYQGQGGTGTLKGSFRHCIVRDLAQDPAQ
jgi:predicted small lipoprotein YifL